MNAVDEIWNRLTREGEATTGYVRLRIPTVRGCPVYAAKSLNDGLEALVIEVATGSLPGDGDFPQSVGFQVSASVLEPGRGGRTRLVLALAGERYRDVFRTLCNDLVSRMEAAPDERAAVHLLLTQLIRWQAFLRVHGPEGLSLEARRGIAGEITFLRDELIPRIGDAAVAAWMGPTGAHFDFQLEHCSIEIKTSAASTPHAFHVSNVRQLDDTFTSALFLCLTLVAESQNSGESLLELIESVRSQISESVRLKFDDRLVEAGVISGPMYAKPKYLVEHRALYRVQPGFPRIVATDLLSGVEDVRYTVAVAACQPFSVDLTATLTSLVALQEDNQ